LALYSGKNRLYFPIKKEVVLGWKSLSNGFIEERMEGIMMELNNKIIEVAENNGFFLEEITERYGEYSVEMNNSTPCGEDWWEIIHFDGTNQGFVEAVRNRADNFDVDEEAEIWIEGRGENGVPNRIKDLVEDAEWKKTTLKELANDLEELDLEEDEELSNREEFYNYITENYEFDEEDAKKLIDNILRFAECNYPEENEQYNILSDLLCGIGLSDYEIRNVYL